MIPDEKMVDDLRQIQSDEDLQNYVQKATEDGTAKSIMHALAVVAQVKPLLELAKKAELSPKVIFETFSGEGDPDLETVVKIAAAMDLKISLEKKPKE